MFGLDICCWQLVQRIDALGIARTLLLGQKCEKMGAFCRLACGLCWPVIYMNVGALVNGSFACF